jgi:hypothetical protein
MSKEHYHARALLRILRDRIANRMPPIHKWHLLCLPRVPMALDLSSSLRARNFQPRVGFGSSLSHSRLNASWPVAYLALGDKCEQAPAILRG